MNGLSALIATAMLAAPARLAPPAQSTAKPDCKEYAPSPVTKESCGRLEAALAAYLPEFRKLAVLVHYNNSPVSDVILSGTATERGKMMAKDIERIIIRTLPAAGGCEQVECVYTPSLAGGEKKSRYSSFQYAAVRVRVGSIPRTASATEAPRHAPASEEQRHAEAEDWKELYRRGNAHALKQEHAQALQAYDDALALLKKQNAPCSNGDYFIHRGRGVVYAMQGKAEEARKEYSNALDRNDKCKLNMKDAEQLRKILGGE